MHIHPATAQFITMPRGAERTDYGVQLKPRSDFEHQTPIWDMTKTIGVPTLGALLIGGLAPRLPGPGMVAAYGFAGIGIAAATAGVTRGVTD